MSLMAGVRIPELLEKQVSIIPVLEGEMQGRNKRLSRKFMGQLAWHAQCKQERLSLTRGVQGLVPEAGLDTPHTHTHTCIMQMRAVFLHTASSTLLTQHA